MSDYMIKKSCDIMIILYRDRRIGRILTTPVSRFAMCISDYLILNSSLSYVCLIILCYCITINLRSIVEIDHHRNIIFVDTSSICKSISSR